VTDRQSTGSNPARPHSCYRCDGTIEPGDLYGAIDVLDPDGELQVLLCRRCAAALRDFLE